MLTVLAWLILVLAVSGLLAWIYQAIILPMEQQRIRFELFRLRDDFRQLVVDEKIKEDSAAFQLLHSSLNAFIRTAPQFDLCLLIKVEKASETKEQERRLEHMQEQIHKSIPEVKEIFDKSVRVMATALILNSVVLLVWAAPPIILSQGIFHLSSAIKEHYRARVEPVFGMRERDLLALC